MRGIEIMLSSIEDVKHFVQTITMFDIFVVRKIHSSLYNMKTEKQSHHVVTPGR